MEGQPIPPAVFYHFTEKLDNLQDHGIPGESKQQIRALTNDIRKVMIDMQKEDLKEWLIHGALLTPEKGIPNFPDEQDLCRS